MTEEAPPPDLGAMANAMKMVLFEMGADMASEDLKETPARFSRMLLEMTSGLREPAPRITVFDKKTSDNMVTMLDIGYWSLCVPSKQYVNAVDGSKPASAVRVGDKLWTLKNGRAVHTTVVEVESHTTREIVEVETTQGTFKITPDHPFATPLGWVEASDLEGCSIEWTAPRSLCRRRTPPKVGYSLGYSIGAMFSDGTTADRYISLVVNEAWFAQRFATALEEAFGIEADLEPVSRPSGYTGEDTPGFRVRVVSSYLADLFRMWAGGDAHHMKQKFPRVVLASREMMQGFIDGYVDGDGSRRRDRNASVIVSGNAEFLAEMAAAIDASFTPNASGKAHQLYVSDSWHREGWFGKHGFRQEDHRTDLLESQWVRVLSVREVGRSAKKPHTVYSFKCDSEPTFLIQGHLSHNCEHHLAPFFGVVHIGYLPGEKIVGLSKFARIVDWVAARPQTQEYMTSAIADHFKKVVEPKAVMVESEGTHLCMSMRGVKKPNAITVTTAIRGDIDKDEFYHHVARSRR